MIIWHSDRSVTTCPVLTAFRIALRKCVCLWTSIRDIIGNICTKIITIFILNLLAKTYVHKIVSYSLLSGLMGQIFLMFLPTVSLESLDWMYLMEIIFLFPILFCLIETASPSITSSREGSGCHLKYFMLLMSR